MQQQMASVPLPNTEIYMVAPVHEIDYAGLSIELVNHPLPVPSYMRTKWISMPGIWDIPICPMIHEDGIDSGTLEAGYTMGCIMLYLPVP